MSLLRVARRWRGRSAVGHFCRFIGIFGYYRMKVSKKGNCMLVRQCKVNGASVRVVYIGTQPYGSTRDILPHLGNAAIRLLYEYSRPRDLEYLSMMMVLKDKHAC